MVKLQLYNYFSLSPSLSPFLSPISSRHFFYFSILHPPPLSDYFPALHCNKEFQMYFDKSINLTFLEEMLSLTVIKARIV